MSYYYVGPDFGPQYRQCGCAFDPGILLSGKYTYNAVYSPLFPPPFPLVPRTVTCD